MNKLSFLVLAIAMLTSVQKDGYAQSEIISGKTVAGKPVAKTLRPAFRNAGEVEKMTDAQLIREVRKENKFDVTDFRTPDDFGVGLTVNEIWRQVKTRSVSSAAEAEKELESLFPARTTGNYTADFIGENDYYYGFRLKHAGDAPDLTTLRVIVYKTGAMFCSFNDKTGYYSEIRALDRNSVFYLLDIDVFFDIFNWHAARVVFRESGETDNEYIYTYYRVYVIEGDWDINDRAVLEKIKCGVDKAKGVKTCNDGNTVLKTVELRGTAKKLKIIP